MTDKYTFTDITEARKRARELAPHTKFPVCIFRNRSTGQYHVTMFAHLEIGEARKLIETWADFVEDTHGERIWED